MGAITKEEQIKRQAELLAKGLKVCYKCHRELPVEQFSKCKSSKDGLRYECKECFRQYYRENKEERLKHNKQYNRQYYQTSQGQIALFNGYAKRRKREETQGNGITKEQWLEMMNFFEWKCAYSGVLVDTQGNRSIDHIIPISKGGEHEVWNCVPMDRSLNKSKKDTDILEWYTSQEFYSKERLDKISAWWKYAYNKWGNTEETI